MMRALAVVLLVLLVLLAWLLMWRAWHRRAQRQIDLPPPAAAPAEPGPLLAVEAGLYVGTTRAGDWLDRVTRHGLGHRAAAEMRVHSDGVLIARAAEDAVWIPAEDILAAGVGDAAAGKVAGRGSVLLLTWQLGGHAVETGFRCQVGDATGPLLMALHSVAPGASS